MDSRFETAPFRDEHRQQQQKRQKHFYDFAAIFLCPKCDYDRNSFVQKNYLFFEKYKSLL
jgi:hypothetical protein